MGRSHITSPGYLTSPLPRHFKRQPDATSSESLQKIPNFAKFRYIFHENTTINNRSIAKKA